MWPQLRVAPAPLLVGALASTAFAPVARDTGAQPPPPAGATVRTGEFQVGGRPLSAEFGEFHVPANRQASRADAKSDSIVLRYVRFPSTARQPGAPIVFLAGGPGDAATRAFRGMPAQFLAQLRAIADVIAFDQRGTGTSEPRSPFCPPGAQLSNSLPGNSPVRSDSLHAQLQRCLEGAGERGINVLGLTTRESADDLMALAGALGAPRLSLLAGSYGTHLALALVQRHPELVDRMVLAGVEGPDHTVKEPKSVAEVISVIAAARRPQLLEELVTIRDRLNAEPASVTAPDGSDVVVNGWDLERWATDALDAVPKIDALLEAMPSLLTGVYDPLARWAISARRPRPLNLMNIAMDCASFGSAERLAQIDAQVRSGVFGNAINGALPALCAVDGLPRLPEAFRRPVHAGARALLIAGTFDGRTPVKNAKEVAAGLPNAELLVIPGASHSLMGHPSATAAMLRVLSTP